MTWPWAWLAFTVFVAGMVWFNWHPRIPSDLPPWPILLAQGVLLVFLVGWTTYRFATAAEPRSYAARAAFVKTNPCPLTGQPRGPCPGYVVDHVVPLCAGGADAPTNMQWQTVEAGKAKDREERLACRR